MRPPAKLIAAAVSVFGLTLSCFGFSLLGPEDTFQTVAIGYDAAGTAAPMNLGEGYRINVPALTYAFDDSFLSYFGATGEAAVQSAFQVLNAIPPASQMVLGVNGDPNVYINGAPAPVTSKGLNFQAQTLEMIDLKSYALTLMINQMGLTSPERYVWCLRGRTILPGGAPTNYTVIQRNFDPISQGYSSFVNGTLYTYHIEDTTGQPNGFADAVEDLADPLAVAFSAVASGTVPAGSLVTPSGLLSVGEFYRGLTRDDFAGLRYLMLPQSYHVESLQNGATLTLGTGGAFSIPGSTTNAVTNLPVVNALRPGINKVSFQLVNFDSLLGTTFALTNTWTDTFVTNGQFVQQVVQRIITVPDIVFSASDLGLDPLGDPVPALSTAVAAPAFVNNANLNSTGNGPTGGPGQINPPLFVVFTKVGPSIINTAPSFLNQLNGTSQFIWATFDGSATPPFIYPQGTSIQQLENEVAGGP